MNVHSPISIEQQLREAHKARQARFAAAARRLQPTSEKPVSVPVVPKAPSEAIVPLPRKMSRLSFVKDECEKRGYTYDQITARDKSYPVLAVRREVIRVTRDRFPEMSLPQLADLFKRDHTTILHSLGMIEGKNLNVSARAKRKATVLKLVASGLSVKDVAAEMGISYCTVKSIVFRNNGVRRAIKLERYHEQARALYDAGGTYASIARELELGASTIRRMAIRFNWPKRSNANG